MANKVASFQALRILFEEEKNSTFFPTTIFLNMRELSATQIGEYLIDSWGFDDEDAYEIATEWIDSDPEFKQYENI